LPGTTGTVAPTPAHMRPDRPDSAGRGQRSLVGRIRGKTARHILASLSLLSRGIAANNTFTASPIARKAVGSSRTRARNQPAQKSPQALVTPHLPRPGGRCRSDGSPAYRPGARPQAYSASAG